MSQAQALYQLQEIDLQMARVQKRLNELAAALQEAGAVAEAMQAAEAAQQKLTPLQAKARDLDLELRSTADKIQSTDAQLYSGRVRNPKELQEMQQEIQSLKKHHSDLEDQLLDTMLKVDDAEAVLKTAQGQLASVKSEWEAAHQQLLDEQTQLRTQAKPLVAQREAAVKAVDPEPLKLYNQLRPRKNNQPVALLVGNSCSVCRVEQDLAVVGEVKRGQKLTTCMSCGRILVYKNW
jgi:predicted  nucleic acid-binding Zn-ribbon protein